MSLIMHRCTACTHPDFFHDTTGECCYGHCPAGKHAVSPGLSEYLVTYTSSGDIAPRCVQPGQRYSAFGRSEFTTCTCPDCWELYGRDGDEAGTP